MPPGEVETGNVWEHNDGLTTVSTLVRVRPPAGEWGTPACDHAIGVWR